jgi:hypothetical protein
VWRIIEGDKDRFKYSGVILQFKRDGVLFKKGISSLVPCVMLWLEGKDNISSLQGFGF